MLGKRKRASRKHGCASSVTSKKCSWRALLAEVKDTPGLPGRVDAFGDAMSSTLKGYGSRGTDGGHHVFATLYTSSKQLAQLADPEFVNWWTEDRVVGLLIPFATRNLCYADSTDIPIKCRGEVCKKARVSIRMINMFMNNFSKEHSVAYKVTAADGQEHVYEPHRLYNQVMQEWTRRGFDLVNREARIYVTTGAGETLQYWPTSVPQLNSLRIIWTTGLLYHILAIEPALYAWYEKTRKSYDRRKRLAGHRRVSFVRSRESCGSQSLGVALDAIPSMWKENDADMVYIVHGMPEKVQAATVEALRW